MVWRMRICLRFGPTYVRRKYARNSIFAELQPLSSLRHLVQVKWREVASEVAREVTGVIRVQMVLL